MHIRYAAAACQTDLPNPIDRRQMRANTDRMLSMFKSRKPELVAPKVEAEK